MEVLAFLVFLGLPCLLIYIGLLIWHFRNIRVHKTYSTITLVIILFVTFPSVYAVEFFIWAFVFHMPTISNKAFEALMNYILPVIVFCSVWYVSIKLKQPPLYGSKNKSLNITRKS